MTERNVGTLGGAHEIIHIAHPAQGPDLPAFDWVDLTGSARGLGIASPPDPDSPGEGWTWEADARPIEGDMTTPELGARGTAPTRDEAVAAMVAALDQYAQVVRATIVDDGYRPPARPLRWSDPASRPRSVCLIGSLEPIERGRK